MSDFKLKMPINLDQLEWDLKSDFSSKPIKRKKSASIVLLEDKDIAVYFKIRQDSIIIYTNIRFLTRLLAMNLHTQRYFQTKDYETRQKYLNWFNDKYKNYILS